jgi:hypothetical protein
VRLRHSASLAQLGRVLDVAGDQPIGHGMPSNRGTAVATAHAFVAVSRREISIAYLVDQHSRRNYLARSSKLEANSAKCPPGWARWIACVGPGTDWAGYAILRPQRPDAASWAGW